MSLESSGAELSNNIAKYKVGERGLRMSSGKIRHFKSKRARDNFERVAQAYKHGWRPGVGKSLEDTGARLDAALLKAGFDPNEPRDDSGKWTDTGGTSGSNKKKQISRSGRVRTVRVFHGTSDKIAKKIKKEGLKAALGHSRSIDQYGHEIATQSGWLEGDRHKAIFVTPYANTALAYATTAAELVFFGKRKPKLKAVVIELRIPRDIWEKDFKVDVTQKGARYTTNDIPPTWIKSIKLYPSVLIGVGNRKVIPNAEPIELFKKDAAVTRYCAVLITDTDSLEETGAKLDTALAKAGFNADQPRDNQGRWSRFVERVKSFFRGNRKARQLALEAKARKAEEAKAQLAQRRDKLKQALASYHQKLNASLMPAKALPAAKELTPAAIKARTDFLELHSAKLNAALQAAGYAPNRFNIDEDLARAGFNPDDVLAGYAFKRALSIEKAGARLDAALAKAGYSPNQARDDHGRWTALGRLVQRVKNLVGRGQKQVRSQQVLSPEQQAYEDAAESREKLRLTIERYLAFPGETKTPLYEGGSYKNEVVKVFHGTTDQALSTLLKEGLVPQARAGATDAVFAKDPHHWQISSDRNFGYVFTTGEEYLAKQYADWAVLGLKDKGIDAKPVVVEINIPQKDFEQYGRFDNDAFVGYEYEAEEDGEPNPRLGPDYLPVYRFRGTIKPEWIKGVITKQVGATGYQMYLVIITSDSSLETSGARLDAALAKAGYDPAQPRNEDGEWTETGASAAAPTTSGTEAKAPAFSIKRINAAVNLAYSHLKSNSRDIIATTAATLLSQATSAGGVSDMEADAMKHHLIHAAELLKVPVHQARDYVIGTYRKMKELNKKDVPPKEDIEKARDPKEANKILDRLIEELQKLDLEKK